MARELLQAFTDHEPEEIPMSKTNKSKKLSLTTQTVRVLDDSELGHANGGGILQVTIDTWGGTFKWTLGKNCSVYTM